MPSSEEVETLSNSINVNTHLSAVLWQRDIRDFNTAKKFFRPSLEHLHDPFLLKDMDHAVKRLKEAIDKNQKMTAFGNKILKELV